MPKFPPDRFDGVPESPLRVGAHRSGTKRHTGWVVFAWAALACGVLVAAGIGVLKYVDQSNQFHDTSTSAATAPATATGTASSSASPSKTTTQAPTATQTPTTIGPSQIDSSVTSITVLNSTQTAGLAANASSALTSAGYVVKGTGDTTSAASSSTVYYTNSATDNAAIALGIAQKLGISNVAQSSAFPNSTITVVLGPDYVKK
ncbi:LytR C-terminal domain-containing protein [Frondihabitans australicus]|uniref:LytR cell envelope-related transcriptional attenuator n=1 Tax=Frondihabitans australicus TaxID=386892 RepID=A0A495IHR5_9MICO|nr:LytR C-terminal domain-containing protein [Frondihabitans australicus]RKR75319.1 LytR cell envelope-related transcriptional attenuator [Frondihabitans australicus]